MGTSLAGQGERLSYVRDPSTSAAFDPCRILEDLHEDGAALAMLPWQSGLRMAASDHLILANASDSGRCLGALAASDRGTEHEPFLFLDGAYLAPAAPALLTLHRMLAFAMLRIAGSESVPSIIAACVQGPCYVGMLRRFGQQFSAAALFPALPEDVVTDLGMASLARRIVRVVRPGSRCDVVNGRFHAASLAYATGGHSSTETLVVLDLSRANDAAILEDARRLYRARLPRGTRHNTVTDLGEPPLQKQVLRDATAM